MKLTAFTLIAAVTASGQAHAADLAFGPSIRAQSYAASLRGAGWLAPEIAFVSEGRQPDHIPNINRVLMLNAVATANVSPRLQVFAKGGLASSRYSTNGSGNGYSNPGKPGYDLGTGLTYWLAPRWGLRLETVYMHHQQSDAPQFENFSQTTAQIVYRTGPSRNVLNMTALPGLSFQHLSLNVNLASVHTRSWARHHLNQFNPGLGLTDQITPDWSASIGFYRNSFRRTSAYALANWTPLHAALPGNWRADAGVMAGLLTGYTAGEDPVRPLAAGLLLRLRAHAGWGVNIVGIPNMPQGSSGFVGLQLHV